MMQRMIRMLRPEFKSLDENGRRIIPTLHDYVWVPQLATIGTFTIMEMLPLETLAKLMAFTNALERKGKRAKLSSSKMRRTSRAQRT